MKAARGLAVAAALAALGGCASEPLSPGSYKSGEVVDAEARVPSAGPEAPRQALALAQRAAVAGLFDLFLSSGAQAAAGGALEASVLAKAPSYIKKSKATTSRRDGGTVARLRALVRTPKLAYDLESLGLIRPAGVGGAPRVLLALSESGLGAGKDVGRASASLRRGLLARGYMVLDASDKTEGLGPGGAGPEKVRELARRTGAELVVTGRASAERLSDPRFDGTAACRASLEVSAKFSEGGGELGAWSQEASAVDISSESAAAKALENAGELAADKLFELMSARYPRRTEISVTVAGLGGLREARPLIEAIRRLPEVSAAALESAGGRDVRLRVFVDKVSPDDLAAALLRVRPFRLSVLSVEPFYRAIEMDAGGSGG